MSHKHGRFNQPLRTREALPRAVRTKQGAQILCPFCTPTHPLSVGEASPCGTQLKLTAVQTIIPARIVRLQKLVCAKCRQGGGEMVQYINGYVHLVDCVPGTSLLRAQPNYSPLAKIVYRLPKGIRSRVVKITGVPQKVEEILPDGTVTGRIGGYFFLKEKVTNVSRQTPEPTA